MRYLLLCMGLLVMAAGCAHQRQYLRPTERVRGQTVQGYDEAFYDLHGAQGRFGETKIWSVGAYRAGEDTIVQITLELHNTNDVPMSVSAHDIELEPLRLSSGDQLHHLRPQETGTFAVQPSAQSSVELHFLLPRDVRPGELHSFVFKWKVASGTQSYAQSTPFREEAPRYGAAYRPYLYYSDVYPCSPYDIHCVGTYWPYEPYYPYSPPPVVVPRDSGRRDIDVRK